MMKRVLTFLLILLSILAVDAKIKIDENSVNKVTNERVIKTGWYSFNTSKNRKVPNIHLRFIYEHGEEFLEIKHIIDGITVINQHQQLVIKTDKNQALYATNISNVYSKPGEGAIGYAGSHALGFTVKYNADFIMLYEY